MPDGLDTNIIMGSKPIAIQNPLDMATKAMTLRDLSQRGQIQGLQMQQAQQEYGDNQAMRNAYSNNTKVDANGNPTQDKQGILKDLATNAPHLVPQAQQKFAEQTSNVIQQHMKMNDMAIQLLQGCNDQASWTAAKQQASQYGLPVDQIPDQYDPRTKEMLLGRALSTKDYLENQVKQKEIGIKEEDLAVKREQFQDTKKSEAFKDLMSHAESSRQLPDVKQAYLDRYNSQKVIDLISSKKDPNKIDYNMVPIISGEIGKIATGGVPTHEELKMITPQDANMIMARTKQYLTSHPEASQQGAFLNVFKDYAGTIQSGANKVIGANIGQLYDSYKDHLKDSDAKNFENTFIKGNPYSLKQTKDAMGETNEETASNKKTTTKDYSVAAMKSYPIGTVLNGQTKTKEGWIPLDASK